MLEKLIEAINRHHTLDAAILAKTLGTNPKMIDSMIETLKLLGKLKRIDLCSSSNCDSCPVTQSCNTSEKKTQIWEVCTTETREDHHGIFIDD